MKPEVDRKRVKDAWNHSVMMQIQETGLLDSDIEQVKQLLKQYNYIKIGILQDIPGTSNKRELVELLCRQCGARLARFRGRTAVIYRSQELRSLE
jgi:RNA-binding protein YhbY